MAKIKLSIIIVNFNTQDLCRRCLDSIFAGKTAKDSWEVIIVDNASEDDSISLLKKYPHPIRLLESKKNLGFAGGNNLGIKESEGEYILLLNSDTEIRDHALGDMVEFMDTHPDAGVSTCKLILPNGKMDPACHRGFPTPWASLTYFLQLERLFPRNAWFGQYHLGYRDMNTVHEIDSPSGAFFLVRRSVIDKVGLLDESYFMYAEDLDWAYRMKEKGIRIFFNPHVSILHIKKQSGRAHKDRARRQKTQTYFYTTMKQFYKKHYQEKYPFLVTGIVLLALDIKLFLNRRF